MKKTMVTLLKALQVSTCIVSAITGTSGRILDATYDVPTPERQRAGPKCWRPFDGQDLQGPFDSGALKGTFPRSNTWRKKEEEMI